MLPDAATCYAAMLARDPAFDGRFFTGVTSTGIYCRNVCPARPPLAKNCTFWPSAAAAAAAGFRACKRCRPDAAHGSPTWSGSAASVRRGLTLIDAGQPTDALGDRLGLGARQVRRLFARHLGTSPVAAVQAKRLAAAVRLIDDGTMPMAEIALASGYGSVRRFNEAFAGIHGESPSTRRRRRAGETMMHLRLSRYAAPVGELLVVTDPDGTLRALDFIDYDERMRRLLARHYPVFTLHDGAVPAVIVAALDGYFAGDVGALGQVPVATGGSVFQKSVWAALRTIPAGSTMSYGALAAQLGNPGGARAVGIANGANPIGIVVPCHRVIGANGTLTGYAGGMARKQWLLAHEQGAQTTGTQTTGTQTTETRAAQPRLI